MRINKIGFNYPYIKQNKAQPDNPPAEQHTPKIFSQTYYPIFTAAPEEMSDEEFQVRKEEIYALCHELEVQEDWDLSKLTNFETLTKNNVKLVKKLLTNKNFPVCEIIPIISQTVPADKTLFAYQTAALKTNFAEQLCEDTEFPKHQIAAIVKYTSHKTLPFAKKLCDDNIFPKSIIPKILQTILNSTYRYEPEDIDYLTKMYTQCTKHPDLYLNESDLQAGNPIQILTSYFEIGASQLLKLASLRDNDLSNILMRKRFYGLAEYLNIIAKLNNDEMKTLKSALKCNNIEQKPLTPNEKVELVEILNAYVMSFESIYRLKNMTYARKIDAEGLKEELIYKALDYCYDGDRFNSDIQRKKLASWDLSFSYLILKQLQRQDPKSIIDVIKLANKEEDFKTAILNTANQYRQINRFTKRHFKKHNLNYEKWITPSKSNEITIQALDDNFQKIQWLADEFSNNVNHLLDSPIKTFIKKKYANYIQNNKLILPEEIANNKHCLVEFMNNFITELDPVWTKAEKNITTKREQAGATLTIKDHIETLINSAEQIQETTGRKSVNLTIKMWDRIPQHDLFQGNYSNCCIGIGNTNGEAIAQYLTKTAFNMIELVDNDSQKTIGNALCYYISTDSGKPALVIDNVEINNTYMPSPNICLKIRDAIKEYAQNLNKEIGNGQDIPIYIGTKHNDVPCKDLNEVPLNPVLIYTGEKTTPKTTSLPDEYFYLDAFGGWTINYDTRVRDNTIYMYKL